MGIIERHLEIPGAKYLWKFFFIFLQVIQRTVYCKLKTEEDKNMAFETLEKNLEPQFRPRKEDFYQEPEDLVKHIQQKNKKGKKFLFLDMDLISWFNKDSDIFNIPKSIPEVVPEIVVKKETEEKSSDLSF